MRAATGARVRALRRSLSDRDLAVLRSLARLRLLSGGQLQRLHVFAGATATRPRRTRMMLQRLHELRLVTRLSRTIGGVRAGSSGYVYALSGLGQSVLDIPGTYGRRRRSQWETKPYFQDHLLQVSELYVRLVEVCRASIAELLAFDAEPDCWRRHAGSGGQTITLKPDAYIRLGVGDIERSVFAEVDLATESPHTIWRKCQAYAAYWRSGIEQQQHGVFPSVLWLVPDDHRQARLNEVIRRLPTDTRALFTVALLSDGPQQLTTPEGGGN